MLLFIEKVKFCRMVVEEALAESFDNALRYSIQKVDRHFIPLFLFD